MPVADGPGEGRFVVDADGAHARPGPSPRAASASPSAPSSARSVAGRGAHASRRPCAEELSRGGPGR